VVQFFHANNNKKEEARGYKVVGKGAYMAPEVYRTKGNVKNGENSQKQSYDPFAADVWCLGVMLFMLYCHAYPFPKFGVYNSVLRFAAHVPKEAVDLLRHIFVPESERLTAEQILKHPFCNVAEMSYQNSTLTGTTELDAHSNSSVSLLAASHTSCGSC